MARRKFHIRSFISFFLFISIFWVLISGTILYIAPPGRVAHWQHWILFGFDKNQWQAHHTIFSYVFFILSMVHIFSINWRNLWSYIKINSKKGLRRKGEFISALAISAAIFIGTTLEIPPLSSFFELGETIGASWEEATLKAPNPHTENLTLDEVTSKYIDHEIDQVMHLLIEKGIKVTSSTQTLKEIGIQNNISPSEIYHIISPGKNESSKGRAGKGYGKLTLNELSSELDMGVEDILSLLEANQIKTSSSKTIREIASEHGFHPSEVIKILRRDHL